MRPTVFMESASKRSWVRFPAKLTRNLTFYIVPETTNGITNTQTLLYPDPTLYSSSSLLFIYLLSSNQQTGRAQETRSSRQSLWWSVFGNIVVYAFNWDFKKVDAHRSCEAHHACVTMRHE